MCGRPLEDNSLERSRKKTLLLTWIRLWATSVILCGVCHARCAYGAPGGLEGHDFTVKIDLVSKWEETLPRSEAIEFVSDVQPTDVFRALEIVADTVERLSGYSQSSETNRYSEEDVDKRVLTALNGTLFRSPFTGPMMALAVYNHYYSARVEFLRSTERDLIQLIPSHRRCHSETWAALCRPSSSTEHHSHGSFFVEALCTESALTQALHSLRKTKADERSTSVEVDAYHPCHLYTFEHFLDPVANPKLPETPGNGTISEEWKDVNYGRGTGSAKIVVFSPLQAPRGFKELTLGAVLQCLKRNALDGLSTTVFRHGSGSAGDRTEVGRRAHLAGFGVELVVKNPEYSTVDDAGPTGKEGLVRGKEAPDEKLGYARAQDMEDDAGDIPAAASDSLLLSADTPNQRVEPENPDRVLTGDEIEGLGLLAVNALHRIRQVAARSGLNAEEVADQQLSALYNMSANFPGEVVRLVEERETVAPSVLQALRQLHKTIYPRVSFVTMNGVAAPGFREMRGHSTQGAPFLTVLEHIGQLLVAVEVVVRKTRIPLVKVLKYLQTNAGGVKDSKQLDGALRWEDLPARLDWREVAPTNVDGKPVMQYNRLPVPPLADVMTDPSTATWPRDIDKFYLLMMFRSHLRVRAPLHHVIVVLDIGNTDHIQKALTYYALKKSFSLRLYVLPIVSGLTGTTLSSNVVPWDQEVFAELDSMFPGAKNALSMPPKETPYTLQKRLEVLAANMFLSLLKAKYRTGKKRAEVDPFKFLKEIPGLLQKGATFATGANDRDNGEVPGAALAAFKTAYREAGGIIIKETIFKKFEEIGQDLKRMQNYVQQKGLVSGIVIVNGKLLPLMSLEQTIEIGVADKDWPQRVTLHQIFSSLVLQDQSIIFSGLMTDAYVLPEDTTALFLSGARVPSCFLGGGDFAWGQETLTPEGTGEENTRKIAGIFCESNDWGFTGAHTQQSERNVVPQWDNFKALAGRIGSLSIQSPTHPLVSPGLLETVSKLFSFTVGDGDTCWPLSMTLIFREISADGLKGMVMAFRHLKALAQKQTLFARTVLGHGLCLATSIRFAVLPRGTEGVGIALYAAQVRQLFELEEILRSGCGKEGVTAISDVLTLAERFTVVFQKMLGWEEGWPAEIEKMRRMSQEAARAVVRIWIREVAHGEPSCSVRLTNGFSEKDLQSFPNMFKQWIALGAWHQFLEAYPGMLVEELLGKRKPDMENNEAVHSSETSSTQVLILNSRLILLSFGKNGGGGLETQDIFDVLEALIVGRDLQVSSLTNVTELLRRDTPKETRQGNTHDMTELDSLAYLASVKERLLNSADAWNIPKTLYDDARLPLRLRFPPADTGLPSPLTLYAILDPLSTAAQLWTPILSLLNRVLNADVRIVVNPYAPGKMALRDYPLNRWYRQVVYFPPVLSLGSPSSLYKKNFGTQEGAVFHGLKTSHTLVVGVHGPESWLIRACHTIHDLDNLRRPSPLSNSNGDASERMLNGTFELSDLVLEGQVTVASPTTRDTVGSDQGGHSDAFLGGQELGLYRNRHIQEPLDRNASKVCDTLVMGNLRYFQLRSPGPGLFWIALGRQTRATMGLDETHVLVMRRLNGLTLTRWMGTSTKKTSIARSRVFPIVINSLSLGKFYQLEVSRVSSQQYVMGHPDLSVLGGLILHQKVLGISRQLAYQAKNRITSLVSWLSLRQLTGARSIGGAGVERIHVFSLASGFMYERLLRIMMRSVRKHTECPLTFWFIDNFLSARFREIMPYMAKMYNLEYHFVTYKWPSWLPKQAEKQRQIWAYKILFLDVLFPNDVTRVIYIDADQVVRSDIAELWRMDLNGRVYAFTPFCDSNTATEGFRFWKQGYWKNHLQGKPYHISALFVVDLVKFREAMAGDILRAVYTSLSRDKNSLANLDQDLPNFAQHELPIFSLSQEWLWCETWCSTETLGTAKTVDLCNNPMTKEPKLSQARRILHEWSVYDQEIRALEDEILNNRALDAEENISGSSALDIVSLNAPGPSPTSHEQAEEL